MTKRKASVALEASNDTDANSGQESGSDNTTNGSLNQTGRLGSSAAGGGASRQNIGHNNNGNNQKCKKERADNWSSAEIQVLHRGIETRKDIFYGPPSQATKKNRELAWEQIVKEVNSVSTTPRSLSQVMKKFKNEKCRAKRKFSDPKEGHNINNSSNLNNNTTSSSNNNSNLSSQNPSNNQQLQPHHMTAVESAPPQTSSINVVKLAPQNVSKTMIDLPSHMHPLQMPGDDMLFFVPEVDGLIGGVNIVSDANGHHHLQKNTNNNSISSQQHSHHNQHTIQAINTGQGLVNGAMGNGMMARTIPAGSMCSLVYSTGSEVCGPDQHMNGTVGGPNSMPSNNINVNAQNLIHHRGNSIETQAQPQQHHQLHQHQQQPNHQQQQPQQSQQPQTQHPPQPHQTAQHHIQPNQITTSNAGVSSIGGNATNGMIGGVAIESHLKNLLFNMLFKEGQSATSLLNSSQADGKPMAETISMIANSLDKIEGHLGKIASVASCFFSQNINQGPANDAPPLNRPSGLSGPNSNLDINNNDGNNSVSIRGAASSGATLNGQAGSDA